MKSYRELHVYTGALQFVFSIYAVCKNFPKDELFALTSQLRRAAVSIVANIAEGAQRQTSKEFVQFLFISYGSCAEVETYLLIAKEMKYISQTQWKELSDQLEVIQRQLYKLISSIRNKANH